MYLFFDIRLSGPDPVHLKLDPSSEKADPDPCIPKTSDTQSHLFQRLTALESPCDSNLDHEDDLCLDDIDSPQLSGEVWAGCGGGPAFCCEECLECFSSPARLKQHEYSHTGETPFQCNVTGKWKEALLCVN